VARLRRWISGGSGTAWRRRCAEPSGQDGVSTTVLRPASTIRTGPAAVNPCQVEGSVAVAELWDKRRVFVKCRMKYPGGGMRVSQQDAMKKDNRRLA
ncbi:MAG: hypothetical protein P3W94_005645, partial [Paracoccus sp. (in: a-proteobacteria)]|nr:hypothetical protein [Paracoccus sp. (in: a-proteobacteria)]